jgi:hypothetical protein
VVTAEAVTMFADRRLAAGKLARVRVHAGQMLATEFCSRIPPQAQARQVFLSQVCPGMIFDTVEDRGQIYSYAGLTGVETQTGPFEMLTPRGFPGRRGTRLRTGHHDPDGRPPGRHPQDGLAHAPDGQGGPLPRLHPRYQPETAVNIARGPQATS